MIASDSQHKEPSSPCLQYPTEDVKLGTDQSTKYEPKTKNKNKKQSSPNSQTNQNVSWHKNKPIKMYNGTQFSASSCHRHTIFEACLIPVSINIHIYAHCIMRFRYTKIQKNILFKGHNIDNQMIVTASKGRINNP